VSFQDGLPYWGRATMGDIFVSWGREWAGYTGCGGQGWEYLFSAGRNRLQMRGNAVLPFAQRSWKSQGA